MWLGIQNLAVLDMMFRSLACDGLVLADVEHSGDHAHHDSEMLWHSLLDLRNRVREVRGSGGSGFKWKSRV